MNRYGANTRLPAVGCPDCGGRTRVVDTRRQPGGRTLRRRRACLACGLRFATREEAIADDTVSAGRRAALNELGRRYLALGTAGQATVRRLIGALEEAALRGATYEARAIVGETGPEIFVPPLERTV